MTVVDVHYTVDVTVAVDLDAGDVSKVIVWDEELRDVPEPFDEGVTPEQKKAAMDVISNGNGWPAWQFGV